MISETIIVALIGAVALIIAAIIERGKKENFKKTIKIKQEVKEKGSTAIGIQNNYGREDKEN